MSDRFNCLGYQIVKVNFTWDDVQVPFLQTTDGIGETIKSHSFSSRQTPDSQWELILSDYGTKLVISAYHFHLTRLNQVDPDLLNISIMKENGHPFRHGKMLSSHQRGCQISKSEISPQSNGKLKFCCTIIALAPKQEPVSLANPNSIAINCSDGLSTQLKRLYDNMQLSDVNFNIGGREFPAHKLILAARSKPFAAMFQHPTKEKLTNQIKIEDVKPEVFHQILRFIYTGRLNLSTMQLMGVEVLIAADKYLLEDLKKECENYLLRKLSPANCLEILLSDYLPCSSEQLKKEAAKFFRCHLEEVMATDQWEKLEKENPTLLSDIQQLISCYE